MQGCMTLLGNAKAQWKDIQKATGKVMDFLTKLREFKPEAVKDKTWDKVRKTYLKDPRFDPVEAAAASAAAANIAKWAQALSEYAIVIKDVEPKKKKYAEVKEVLDSAMKTLKEKQDAVQEVKDKVEALERETKRMMDEKEALEAKMTQSTARMGRAEKLVVLLADEGVRWG